MYGIRNLIIWKQRVELLFQDLQSSKYVQVSCRVRATERNSKANGIVDKAETPIITRLENDEDCGDKDADKVKLTSSWRSILMRSLCTGET